MKHTKRMTYLEKLQKAKSEKDFGSILFEFEVEVQHNMLSKKGTSIEKWLHKEADEKETVSKALAQLLYMMGRKEDE